MNRRKLLALLGIATASSIVPQLQAQPIAHQRLTKEEFKKRLANKLASLGEVPEGIARFIELRWMLWFERSATIDADEAEKLFEPVTLESAVRDEEEDYQKEKSSREAIWDAMPKNNAASKTPSHIVLPPMERMWSRTYRVKGKGWVRESGFVEPPKINSKSA